MTNIALVYDADYTLMDGYHPSVILKRRGIDTEKFWKHIAQTQQRELEKGDKTKVTMRYRGREFAHQELGMQLLKRVEADLEDIANVEQMPNMEGRQMVMLLGPKKAK